MAAIGLDVFDKTLQTTHIWLDELMKLVGPDRQVAWDVLGAVMRVLRDRIPLGLAAHLGSQLPLLVRGLYYDQWEPEKPPLKIRDAEEFLLTVTEGFGDIRPVNAKEAMRAVFNVLSHHIDPGQARKVQGALPEEIRRQLWPDSFFVGENVNGNPFSSKLPRRTANPEAHVLRQIRVLSVIQPACARQVLRTPHSRSKRRLRS